MKYSYFSKYSTQNYILIQNNLVTFKSVYKVPMMLFIFNLNIMTHTFDHP